MELVHHCLYLFSPIQKRWVYEKRQSDVFHSKIDLRVAPKFDARIFLFYVSDTFIQISLRILFH